MEVKVLINYKDYTLNKDIKAGEDLVKVYETEGIELTKERLDVLLKGNASSGNKPFVEVKGEEKPKPKKEAVVETADVKFKEVEKAVVKPRKKSTK